MIALILILVTFVLQLVVNWFLYRARKRAQSGNGIEVQDVTEQRHSKQVLRKSKKHLLK